MSEKGGADSSALPDLVYLVRSGENEELRYSLRSVTKNAKGLYRNIWVVGTGLPEWLNNVYVLPVPDGTDKHETMRRKTLAICDHPDLSDTFVLMNDDYFLVEKITEWVVYHMGPVSKWLQSKLVGRVMTTYLRDVYLTADWMRKQGYGDVLVRETHSATVWDKRKLAATIRKYPENRGLTVVELYDAAGAGGEGQYALNAKVHKDDHLDAKLAAADSPWLSSSDVSWKKSRIGAHIRKLFPRRCRYEKAGV